MACENKSFTYLHRIAFPASFAIVWALALIMLAILSHWFVWAATLVEALAVYYIGYGSSVLGVLCGAVLGFLDMFIGLFFVVLLHNAILKRMT